MNQPDWINTTLTGALVGYLLPFLAKLLWFAVRRFQQEVFEGNWYEYHINNRNGEYK
jgi:hypothetical protein